MTEKEKMLEGKLYNASDSQLKHERLHAQRTCFRYNNTDPKHMKERKSIIRGLLGSTDAMFCIEQPFYCDYGSNISIGNNFFSNYNLIILDCNKVTIGNNVMIGPNVSIFTAGHPIDPEVRQSGLEFALPVTIGNNVWIGGNVVITPNVTIGDNSVIGAGSVVTNDIPSNVVAVGNPCKVIRQITEEDKSYKY